MIYNFRCCINTFWSHCILHFVLQMCILILYKNLTFSYDLNELPNTPFLLHSTERKGAGRAQWSNWPLYFILSGIRLTELYEHALPELSLEHCKNQDMFQKWCHQLCCVGISPVALSFTLSLRNVTFNKPQNCPGQAGLRMGHCESLWWCISILSFWNPSLSCHLQWLVTTKSSADWLLCLILQWKAFSVCVRFISLWGSSHSCRAK